MIIYVFGIQEQKETQGKVSEFGRRTNGGGGGAR